MGIKIHMDNQKIKHIFLTLSKCIWKTQKKCVAE